MTNVGPAPGPIVNGKDFNYFSQISTSSGVFGVNPDVQISFRGTNQRLRLDIISGSGIVSYSFNGNTVHGILTPSTTYNYIDFGIRSSKLIWFKTSTGTSVIRVEAWLP